MVIKNESRKKNNVTMITVKKNNITDKNKLTS